MTKHIVAMSDNRGFYVVGTVETMIGTKEECMAQYLDKYGKMYGITEVYCVASETKEPAATTLINTTPHSVTTTVVATNTKEQSIGSNGCKYLPPSAN